MYQLIERNLVVTTEAERNGVALENQWHSKKKTPTNVPEEYRVIMEDLGR